MIQKIKIINYANKKRVAMFDTHIVMDNRDKGRRVKHIVAEDDDMPGCYIHYQVFLTEEIGPCNTGLLWVSERVFFGKVRLCVKREGYTKETWNAIAQCINYLSGENAVFKWRTK